VDDYEVEFRAEVEARTDRSFERVQEQLGDMFELEWEQIEVAIATSASKGDRSEADVVVDLIAKADAREAQPVTEKARRAVIRWIGKPWRERDDPWGKYAGRVRELRDEPGRTLGEPPPTTGEGEPWEPLRPDE
jgi:hypothetical protein